MATQEKGPALSTGPNETATRLTSRTSVVQPARRLPGERAETLARARNQRERYGQLMGLVREILTEQPSPATLRTAGRHIAADVTTLATSLADELGEQAPDAHG